MRRILFGCFALLFNFFGIAQTQTYADVLAKEIIANSIENTSSAQDKPYVIMVSLDGFRYDYAEKHDASNILKMAKQGASVQRLLPSFPSKTFPNHYTLATGLYPQHHGIVANSFIDTKTQKRYSIGNRNAVEDGSWYGGLPLWNLAQLQGMVAASFFWVGSEANVNGLHPKYYYQYDKKLPYALRVKRVLDWLRLPEKQRPHMITLYFSLVDTQGHRFGPNGKETKEAVQFVDEQIGALREGIAASGLPVYLIVTSDHGMAEIKNLINIKDYIDVPKDQFFGGPVGMVYTKSEEEKQRYLEKLNAQKRFLAYAREAVPEYLNFNGNSRIGDLVLIAEPPFTFTHTESKKREFDRIEGTHGFDPFVIKEMGGILYVEGPRIKKNTVLAPVENIHIYPLVAELLGLNILMPVDGKLEVLQPMLTD